MSRALAPAEIALCAQAAGLLEVAAVKPGNVTRYHDFDNTRFEDFLLSAVAMGAALGAAGSAGAFAGRRDWRCVSGCAAASSSAWLRK